MSFISDFLGGKQASESGKAAKRGANVAAAAQTEALEYLREREAVPQGIRDEALTGLSEYFQVPGPPRTQEELIAEAQSSPLYAAILGSREAGEEAILRGQSATGGLRSGGSSRMLSDYSMQLENQALLESYNQAQVRADYERSINLAGLTGLAQLPSGARDIAGLTAGIGMTEAQGITARAQAKQQGEQNVIGNLFGIAELILNSDQGTSSSGGEGDSEGSAMTSIMSMFSDIRLKNNIEYVGERNGYPWYKWDWSEGAATVGLEGSSEGVMAHHVVKTHPEAIGERDGFLTVDYGMIDLEEAA